ncbi:MAG: OmpH family outer membrane protein [Bacteroidales bacterium]|nr:OmpH family outer membrane protein [Bacteroidales bacterium]
MKKTQIIVDTILSVAVVALFVLHFVGKPCCKHAAEGEATPVEGNLPIAYINLDSLLSNYTLAQECGEQLMKKQEDARLKLNTKMRTFQNEYADFQRKIENNAFLSRERAESEANRLQRKQEELQALEEQLTQDILTEQQQLNIRLADSLTNYLNEYNKDGRFHLILSNQGRDNVLTAVEGYDITDEITEALNARYTSKKKK